MCLYAQAVDSTYLLGVVALAIPAVAVIVIRFRDRIGSGKARSRSETDPADEHGRAEAGHTLDDLLAELRRRGVFPRTTRLRYEDLTTLGKHRYWRIPKKPRLGRRETLEAINARAAAALVDKAPPRASSGDDVDASVFSPARVAPGDDFLVQVLIHRPEQDRMAFSLAAAADPSAQKRAARSLAIPVEPGTVLDVQLSMPGLVFDDPVQPVKWDGRPAAAQFVVVVPSDYADRGPIGTVTVSRQGVPIGSLRWRQVVATVSKETQEPEAQGEWVSRFHKAFISYATPDRPQVLTRVQLLQALDIDYFQDVLDLEPGQRWERELYRQIAECDLFLLFWSSAAKESKWVRSETGEALRLADASGELGQPTLTPVLIEGPPVPTPWPELSHLHFNDKLLYLMT